MLPAASHATRADEPDDQLAQQVSELVIN